MIWKGEWEIFKGMRRKSKRNKESEGNLAKFTNFIK